MMPTSELNFGVPDIELEWASGGKLNPSRFVGHQLLVLFLPLNESKAAVEREHYGRLASEFAKHDSWLVMIGGSAQPGFSQGSRVALDPDDIAWSAFTRLAKRELDRSAGAAFLFTRGGSLFRSWEGSGHAGAVLTEIGMRA